MNKFAIITDMTCDMPSDFFVKNDVDVASMTFNIGDKEYNRDNAMSHDEFYDMIRAGAMPTTSQTDLEDVSALMEKRLVAGEDVLYLCFSSGVSGSYDNINNIVRRDLLERYPERKIIVIDSLCGSCGLGMLAERACKMRDEGKNIEEVAHWIEDHKLNMQHFYVIGDLKLLMKGGRISKTQAIIGSIIGIKPLVTFNAVGKNHPIGKAKGKKKAVAQLIKYVENNIVLEDNDFIMTTHSGCKEEVEEFNKALKDRFGLEVLTAPLSYLVGSHCGPDTMGVFFWGKTRE